MSSEFDETAARILELSNTVGATAANVQNVAPAARTLRSLLAGAARRPERVAVTGVGLIVLSGVLALRRADEVPAGGGASQAQDSEDR